MSIVIFYNKLKYNDKYNNPLKSNFHSMIFHYNHNDEYHFNAVFAFKNHLVLDHAALIFV